MHRQASRFSQLCGVLPNPNRALFCRSQHGEFAVASHALELGDSMPTSQFNVGASRLSAAPGNLSVVAAAEAAARFAAISASGPRSALQSRAPCMSASSRRLSAWAVAISVQHRGACRIFGGMGRTTLFGASGGVEPRPNPSLNRTLHGMPVLGFISFLPKSVMPLRAGYLER